MNKALQKIISSLKEGGFIRLVLSPPKTSVRKIGKNYQLTETKGAQAFHKNLSSSEILAWLESCTFKQGQLFCEEADYHLFFPDKVIKNRPTSPVKEIPHNRQKKHLLSLEAPPPYFKALGIKRDKFLQIEKFLNEVKAILPRFKSQKELQAVDFGCGKAYLTFALYDYLKNYFEVNLIGLDLKKEVMENCQKLADDLGFTGLKFIHGTINAPLLSKIGKNKVDLAVALHACDTATDDALAQAVSLNAQVILAAPCCQHQLYHQINNPLLAPLLKHGVLKERLAALATDALRGAALEQAGYDVKIVEFIDAAHTPKNILIRALFTGRKPQDNSLKSFKEFLGIANL